MLAVALCVHCVSVTDCCCSLQCNTYLGDCQPAEVRNICQYELTYTGPHSTSGTVIAQKQTHAAEVSSAS